ncbi:hypothetical protein P9139_03840 [Curtobacterium flaccumfaciens]|nr:hypothetical protein P9139_03840 [Curtobacterium flaccumfaciens]
MTAYFYDKDVKGSGKSTCTGGCASAWPAIESAAAAPSVSGVTGTIGTITGEDGKLQVTVDGRPIYTYAADRKPGDVTGQGVGGVWYAVDRTGPSTADRPSGGGGPGSSCGGRTTASGTRSRR